MDYATVISEVFSDPERLERLRRDSRNAFETRLNWKVWGHRVSELIRSL